MFRLPNTSDELFSKSFSEMILNVNSSVNESLFGLSMPNDIHTVDARNSV